MFVLKIYVSHKLDALIFRDAVLIPLINCGTSFMAGFAIFSVIGFMSLQANLPVDKVITSGKYFQEDLMNYICKCHWFIKLCVFLYRTSKSYSGCHNYSNT